jgi:hypothetical protein
MVRGASSFLFYRIAINISLKSLYFFREITCMVLRREDQYLSLLAYFIVLVDVADIYLKK